MPYEGNNESRPKIHFSIKDFFILVAILAAWIVVGVVLVATRPTSKLLKNPPAVKPPFKVQISSIKPISRPGNTNSFEEIEEGDPAYYDNGNEASIASEGGNSTDETKNIGGDSSIKNSQTASPSKKKLLELIKFPGLKNRISIETNLAGKKAGENLPSKDSIPAPDTIPDKEIIDEFQEGHAEGSDR